MKAKYLWLVSMFICIGAFFTAHVPFDARLAVVSTLSMIGFAIPSFFFLHKSIGTRKTIFVLTLLSVYALSIETFAILTGFPYGEFTYGGKLGAKLFGITPWTVPFAWVPLVLGTMAIAQRITNNPVVSIIISTFLLVITDLLLDPGAVALGFWTYTQPSVYYDVPFSNFIGWVFSGFVGSSLLYFFTKGNVLNFKITISLYFTLLFWINITVWKGMVLPCLAGIMMLSLLSYYACCKKV